MAKSGITRRQALQGGGWAALAALAAAHAPAFAAAPAGEAANAPFASVPRGVARRMRLAKGYKAHVIARWGDALFPDMPAFDPARQTPDAAARRFGTNNDFTAFLPLGEDRALLWVNHEFAIPWLMFPDWQGEKEALRSQVAIEQRSLGGSVLELRRGADGRWRRALGGKYARRVHGQTPCRVSGPAAGHALLKTKDDPTGRRVLGTFANCAGGVTPWGTVLTCEENFNEHFLVKDASELQKGYYLGSDPGQRWGYHDARFDASKTPNELHRFGWVVEVDPLDPGSMPVKRTALGRFKHECAAVAELPDGRIAVYMSDDQTHEHLYRFVTKRAWSKDDRAANADLLDEGTLYAAKLGDDGSLRWIALPEDAMSRIETRGAAGKAGASKLDRPEGIAVSGGAVFVSLTKDPLRVKADAVHPQVPDVSGMVLALEAPDGAGGRPDHGAERFRWRHVRLGDQPWSRAGLFGKVPFANPDNIAIDPAGKMWVCTDGMEMSLLTNDGLYLLSDDGGLHCLLRAPLGGEVSGPSFSPDGKTLFVSIQHPGEGSYFDDPSTRWPDWKPGMPPRSAVVAVTREDGGAIGAAGR